MPLRVPSPRAGSVPLAVSCSSRPVCFLSSGAHGPRILALVSAPGSGKTRSVLELLCSRFGLLLVADSRYDDGAGDFWRAVAFGRGPGADMARFGRHVAACVLARLLVLEKASACGWTPAQFLHIQLFANSLFIMIQERLADASEAALHDTIKASLRRLKIKGLPIVLDEAQVLLYHPEEGGESLFKRATAVIGQYAKSTQPCSPVVIVSGTSWTLLDVEPLVASNLLKPGEELPHMAPSLLEPADAVNVVAAVVGSAPPDAVGQLLQGRGRFVMTFLTELLRVEIADAARRRGRDKPAAGDARTRKRARTARASAWACSGAGAGADAAADAAVDAEADAGTGVRVGGGAGANTATPSRGQPATIELTMAGTNVDGTGDDTVPVVTLHPHDRGTDVWLQHLHNAERLMLFGGRSIAVHLTLVVNLHATANSSCDQFAVVRGLFNAAIRAALGAPEVYMPQKSGDAARLFASGLASLRVERGEPRVVVFEPLVWRAILVHALEQHHVGFEELLSTTMKLSYKASPSALGFLYKLVQPSRWATMFHGRFVDEVPLFNTWHPLCLPEGRSLGDVYNARMEVVGLGTGFQRSGHARPFRGSVVEWLTTSAGSRAPVCFPPVNEGPDACMVVKLSNSDGSTVLRVLMFIKLAAMKCLSDTELAHAKGSVIVGRMGNAQAKVTNEAARHSGEDRAAALARSVDDWTNKPRRIEKPTCGVVGWLLCPRSALSKATTCKELVTVQGGRTQTLFNVDARVFGKGNDSDAGVERCEVLAKGAMLAELTKWSS